jgi:hypothetical protein
VIYKATPTAAEKISVSFSYPPEYQPKTLEDEYATLRGIFSSISGQLPVIGDTLPEGAEKLFVIPDWRQISSSRAEATQKMLEAIRASNRKLYNYRERFITDTLLRINQLTDVTLETIRKCQQSSMFVIPAQFGILHRGQSVSRARTIFRDNEFGFGAFEVGCMLLANPERLVRWEQLQCDCPGDEFELPVGGDQQFLRAPIFVFDDEGIKFSCREIDEQSRYYGSVSGFLPQ